MLAKSGGLTLVKGQMVADEPCYQDNADAYNILAKAHRDIEKYIDPMFEGE